MSRGSGFEQPGTRVRGMLGLALLLVVVQAANAGGPAYVAGASYFDPSTKGVPLTWAQGQVRYYTDQGDLSTLLPQAAADAFVADAFSRWTLLPTVALQATQGGHLAEDVSGQNVIANPDGTISMPSDLLPSAVGTPLGIVYDSDGKVTDALLGTGAGGSSLCSTNSVYGGIDHFGTDAHFVHAVVIMNGNCAQTSSQLNDMKYRLVRVLGRTMGLGWSQVNVNVFTRVPPWTPQDLNGLSIMHAVDPISCVPVANCYPGADQPRMDDRAAISRLYPVTAQNAGSFPGKQIFSDNTARIHGTVYFTDGSGVPLQGMQGVNVIARWIDPSTGTASRSVAASSISGFLFRGNAGNPVNGPDDATGQRYDRFGSDDQALEGFFDLAGLELPNGASSAQFQLTVEAVDATWSKGVEPYGRWQVQPSGTAQPIMVTVTKGGDVQQDILMQGSTQSVRDWFEPASFAVPAPVPASGDWTASLSGYGNADFFWFSGQGNRSVFVEVTAIDDTGVTSESKALPVIGIWPLSAPPGTPAPAATPMAFNTLDFGVSRLSAQLLGATNFRIGIADYRGDGRPDFRYRAHVFYGDSVNPQRASVLGGTPLAITGVGFRPGTAVGIGYGSAPLLAQSSTQLTVIAPGLPDGVQDITLADPGGKMSATMAGALIYGAAASDTIKLISGGNPATAVGGEAPKPVRVRAVMADGITAVAGASVVFTAVPAASLSACAGASTCTVVTDESGEASTRVTVLTAGTITITAALAPASYNPPQTVQATVLGTASSLDLALVSSYHFVAQGATLDVSLKGRVLSQGYPVAQRSVTYRIVGGTGTLSAPTVTTDTNGYASTTLHLAPATSSVQISVCVEPGDSPCQPFYVTVVPTAALRLQPVAGSLQVATSGQSLHPVTVRVTDNGTPANPVEGADVIFDAMVCREPVAVPGRWVGDTYITRNPAPIILSSSRTVVRTDQDGLATMAPSFAVSAGVKVEGTSTAGASSVPFQIEILPGPANGGGNRAPSRGVGLRSMRLAADPWMYRLSPERP